MGGDFVLPQQWRHTGEEPVISVWYEWNFPKTKVEIIKEEKIIFWNAWIGSLVWIKVIIILL